MGGSDGWGHQGGERKSLRGKRKGDGLRVQVKGFEEKESRGNVGKLELGSRLFKVKEPPNR